jgi:hypothetical protein
MGWDTHSGRQYYTRTRRVGGRFVRQYLGRGEVGELAAAADACRRAQRHIQAEHQRAERVRWQAADQLLRELVGGVALLVRAAVLVAGYRQHARGEWRRRRMDTTTKATPPLKGREPAPLDPQAARGGTPDAGPPPEAQDRQAETPQAAAPSAEQILEQRLRELARRVEQGDPAARAELRQALDDNPRVWQTHANLALQAQEAWLGLAADPDRLLREALRRNLEELQADLAGPEPSPVERLLVGRAAALWLQVHHADLAAAQARGTPAALRELQLRQESAERRFQAAIKQLAVVRKLLRPVLSPLDLALRPSAGRAVERAATFNRCSRVVSPEAAN